MCVKGRNVRDESAVKFSTLSLHAERAAHVIFVTKSEFPLTREEQGAIAQSAKVARITTPASVFMEELFASRSGILQDDHASS